MREAVGNLTQADIEAMRDANRRFGTALEVGDVDAALRADDELHTVPVAVAANRALVASSTSSRRCCAVPSGCASRQAADARRSPGTTS